MNSLTRYPTNNSSRNTIFWFLPFFVLSILYVKIGIYRYVLLALLLVPFLLSSNIRSLRMSKKYIVLLLFFVFQFFSSILHTSLIQTIKNSAQYFINLSPIIIFDYFIKGRETKKDKNAGNLVLLISFLLIAYCVIASIIYMRSSPYALRNLSTYNPNIEAESDYYLVSIGGGYPLLFAVLLLLPFFISKLKFRFSTIVLHFFASLVFIAVIVYLFLISSVTTCLFAVVISLLLSLLFRRKKATIVVVLTLVIGFTAFIVFAPGLLENIINFISEPFKNNVVIYARLKEIVPAIYGGDRSSSFGMRINCFLRDISTIRNHPLFGAGFYYGYDYLTLARYVGWHSEWLDLLAEFGLVMGGMLLYFIFKSFIDVYKYLKLRTHKIVFAVSVAVVIFMGFMDPILTTNMFFVLFILLPLLFRREANDSRERDKHS